MKYGITLSLTLLALFLLPSTLQAQENGVFSGAIQTDVKFFQEDAEIEAANTPQYDNELTGIETWVNLQYAYKGFTVGARYDFFNNSNIPDPNNSYSGQGIGRWWVHKKINKVDITAGYIYDQIGTGIIFRAYEARPLFIDNALKGLRLAYDLNDNWKIVGFAGNQKNVFEEHGTSTKGAYIDGFIEFENSKLKLAPGVGIVNRTFDDETVNGLVDAVKLYRPEDRQQVDLKYNTYAYTLYNRLSYGPFNWYIEAALKPNGTYFDPTEPYLLSTGESALGQVLTNDGSVYYTSLSYAKKGLGITLEGKRTENFMLRTDPLLQRTDGIMNFLTPLNRENTYRLTARYVPAVQFLGEMAYQADIRYAFNKKFSANVNISHITDLDDNLLYNEYFTELLYKHSKKWRISGGLQIQEYNQDIFEGKPGVDNVKTITPFVEFLYKFSRKKSLRIEGSYLKSDQDLGSWAYALAEYSIAPHWIFTASDMYNIDPKKSDKKTHYPTAGIIYSHRASRFGLSYIKQVSGIVCTGGICRLEPAFSGVRFNFTTSF